MQRVRSTLPDLGFPLVLIAWANMLLLLCICVLLNNHTLPQFGYDIHSAESHFSITTIDRTHTHIITISAGDKPRFFLNMEELPDSWEEIDASLKELSPEEASRTHIVIVQDEAVSAGTTQRLVDLILMNGYRCSLAARPYLD